jgi:hypothetical protein
VLIVWKGEGIVQFLRREEDTVQDIVLGDIVLEDQVQAGVRTDTGAPDDTVLAEVQDEEALAEEVREDRVQEGEVHVGVQEEGGVQGEKVQDGVAKDEVLGEIVPIAVVLEGMEVLDEPMDQVHAEEVLTMEDTIPEVRVEGVQEDIVELPVPEDEVAHPMDDVLVLDDVAVLLRDAQARTDRVLVRKYP